MPLVLRLECKETRKGVYTSGILKSVEYVPNLSFQDNGGRHPTPFKDSGLKDFWVEALLNKDGRYYQDYKFGFATYEQFRAWFYNDRILDELEICGIILSIYKSNDVKLGWSQVCFYYPTASLVGELRPTVTKDEYTNFILSVS